MASTTAGETAREPGRAGRAATPTGAQGRTLTVLSWILRIVAAVILFQTLFFKFTAAEESVYIFNALGMEPWGRIGSGVAELIACALLLIPRTAALGALLALGVMAGAIVSHVTRLGVVVRDDGGLLFGLALVTAACSLGVILIRRRQLSLLARSAGSGEPDACPADAP